MNYDTVTKLEYMSCDINRVADLVSALRDALQNGAEELHDSALDIPDDYLRNLNDEFKSIVNDILTTVKAERKAGAKA